MHIRNILRRLASPALAAAGAMALAGCASLGASGPSGKAVARLQDPASGIAVVELTDAVARAVIASQPTTTLAAAFGTSPAADPVVGPGDVLDIAIWEAPPAALFGTVAADSRLSSTPAVGRSAGIPEQMVDGKGRIAVPFVGSIEAVGRTPREIAREIVARLAGKANDPQVIVRIAENRAANVTVVGEVQQSRRVPLSTRGERLLDVLASAGGVKQPVEKVTIQVTRGNRAVARPLARVIADPAENIVLRADDVVTALYRPYSFQALGAVGNNAEIEFEATGITLAQALGRIGGLQDNRADIKGVFIFRLEDPALIGTALPAGARTTPDGRVPVIYRVDLSAPATLFVAQGFPIRDRDVVYVSNAPLVDIQKFMNVVSTMAFSVIGIGNAVN